MAAGSPTESKPRHALAKNFVTLPVWEDLISRRGQNYLSCPQVGDISKKITFNLQNELPKCTINAPL
jgi:hypothetical protein